MQPACHRRAPFAAVLPLLLCLAAPGAALAQWVRDGSEFQINAYTTNSQYAPAVSLQPDGGFFVVWSGQSNGDNAGVSARHFDANDVADDEFRVHTVTAGFQKRGGLATDPNSATFVAWDSQNVDGNQYGVVGRRVDASGPLGSDFVINQHTTGTQRLSRVAAQGTDRFVVAWQSNDGDGSSYGVFGRLVDATGPVGNEFQVNTYTTNAQRRPAIVTDATGGFVVVWDGPGSDGPAEIWGQRYDSVGGAIGQNFRINFDTVATQTVPRIGMDSTGGFVVVWTEGYSVSVEARRFDSTGTGIGSEFQVNAVTSGILESNIEVDPDGSFTVVWSQGSPDTELYAQSYDSSGSAIGTQFLVNSFTTGSQLNVSLSTLDGNSLVSVWESDGQDGSVGGIFGQRWVHQTFTPTPTTGPSATPTTTPPATPTPTATATPTATWTASSTPTPTRTASSTASRTGTPTPTRTATPIPSSTATRTATLVPTSTATSTRTPLDTATPTPPVPATSTPTPTDTAIPTPPEENVDPENSHAQFAHGANFGWMNAEPASNGAGVSDTELAGWLWSANAGWISLSCENTASCDRVEYRVHNDGIGNLSGWGWSPNAGWINFAPMVNGTPLPARVDPASGLFCGHAWSANLGWIRFELGRTDPELFPYRMRTSWHVRVTPTPATLVTPIDGDINAGEVTGFSFFNARASFPALKFGGRIVSGDASCELHLGLIDPDGQTSGALVLTSEARDAKRAAKSGVWTLLLALEGCETATYRVAVEPDVIELGAIGFRTIVLLSLAMLMGFTLVRRWSGGFSDLRLRRKKT